MLREGTANSTKLARKGAKKITRTLPPKENETKHLIKAIRTHVEESSETKVSDFEDVSFAARELLERLFLLSMEFKSYEGALSRVVGKQRANDTDTSTNWQDLARNRNNAFYGLNESLTQVQVIELHRAGEYRLVHDLMEMARLKIDTRTNQGEATDKPTDINTCHFYDLFLDRSHSIWLANRLLDKNESLIADFERLNESHRLLEAREADLRDWQTQDANRNPILNLLGFFWRRNNTNYYERMVAEAEAAHKDATINIGRTQIELGRTLLRVYSNDEINFEQKDLVKAQKHRFYEEFFGRTWPTEDDFREPELPIFGEETLTNRQAYIKRMQKLKTRIFMCS